MRTVTFADPKLVDYLRHHFVFVWHNQSPDLYAEVGNQETPDDAQAAAYPEGGGGGNVRSYFCAADGTVVTYLEGFWQPASYLREAIAAADTCGELRKVADADGAKLVIDRLRSRRRQIASDRNVARTAVLKKRVNGQASEIDVIRTDGPYGLLDRSLAASESLAKKPVAAILSELAARNRFHGAIV